MASIRSKCTTNAINNNNNNTLKLSSKNLDQISGSHQSNGINGQQQSSRPILRWSQSFSPNDRQKPNVSTLIRRKSAVERLAETKYNYIKCSSQDWDVNEDHKYIRRSLSTGKTPLVILSQTLSPTIISSNSQSPSQTVTRKRNSSLSSRLSDCSNNLEIQLRQLIADDDNDSQLLKCNTTNNNNNNRINNNLKKDDNKKDSVIKSAKKPIESPVKTPKPKERFAIRVEQNVKQSVNKVIDRNSGENNNNKTSVNNNCVLRFNSSHNKHNTNQTPKPMPRKPSAQAVLQTEKASPMASTSGTTPVRQLSISRSKSDVSNRLIVRRSKSKDEIERFFETLGLDSSVWDSIRSEATNSLISTPNNFFESSESIPSGVRKVVHMSSSSSSTSSTHSTTAEPIVRERNGLNSKLMQSRSCHALSSGTSIVEKNARVIKWLFNCRKAMV